MPCIRGQSSNGAIMPGLRPVSDQDDRMGSSFTLLSGHAKLPDCVQERTPFANFQYGEDVPFATVWSFGEDGENADGVDGSCTHLRHGAVVMNCSGEELPNASYNSRPGFGQECFSGSRYYRWWRDRFQSCPAASAGTGDFLSALLIPPVYVKPYVKRGKSDAGDAVAICEAVMRPRATEVSFLF